MNPVPGQPTTCPELMGQGYRRGENEHLDVLVQLTGELMLERIVFERHQLNRQDESLDFILLRNIAYYVIGLIAGEQRLANQMNEVEAHDHSHCQSPLFYDGYSPGKVANLADEITRFLGYPCCNNELQLSILNKLDEAHGFVATPQTPRPGS